VALVAINVIVYAPVRHHDFVALDDTEYVTENRQVTGGLTWPAVAWAFTTDRVANWHPLTWLSHMLDVQLFGVNAGPHHVTNLALHVLNTLLLFVVLRRMTGHLGRSAFVAALFAVHPLHVESVAWIAERKDVLSTLFWMLTLWAYVEYVRKPRWHRYALVLVFFALGLMAKSMLVTLPFVLLLLDVWPLGRLQIGRRDGEGGGRKAAAWLPVVREKLPLIALAAASSVVTLAVQQHGGAVGALATFPLGRRVANALVAYVSYLGKTIWPGDLSVFYRYPDSVPLWPAAAALAVLIGISVSVARLGRRRPCLAVGWLWYLGTLVPVIGLVQVGRQAMADRYTYVPLVGVFMIAAWGVPDLLARWPARRRVLPAVASIVIVLCAATARAQVRHWEDSLALWRHALEVDPANYYAHTGLGLLAADRGRTSEAMEHFSEAIRIAPDYAQAHDDLGLMLMKQGRMDEAIARYTVALQMDPALAEAHNNLGAALAARSRRAEALTHYAEAVRLVPDDGTFRNNMGQALANQGRIEEAMAQFNEALRLRPDLAIAHDNLGLALVSRGRIDEAIAHYTDALRLNPGSAGTHNNLGIALSAHGKLDEAIAQYAEALRLGPDRADAHNNLGFTLAAQGRVAEAIPHFLEAIRLQPDFEMAHQFLGVALAGTGRFNEAITQFHEVLRINPENEGARRALEKLATHVRSQDAR
jgi:tetratricopeptide (TPR) repeat protein